MREPKPEVYIPGRVVEISGKASLKALVPLKYRTLALNGSLGKKTEKGSSYLEGRKAQLTQDLQSSSSCCFSVVFLIFSLLS